MKVTREWWYTASLEPPTSPGGVSRRHVTHGWNATAGPVTASPVSGPVTSMPSFTGEKTEEVFKSDSCLLHKVLILTFTNVFTHFICLKKQINQYSPQVSNTSIIHKANGKKKFKNHLRGRIKTSENSTDGNRELMSWGKASSRQVQIRNHNKDAEGFSHEPSPLPSEGMAKMQSECWEPEHFISF